MGQQNRADCKTIKKPTQKQMKLIKKKEIIYE